VRSDEILFWRLYRGLLGPQPNRAKNEEGKQTSEHAKGDSHLREESHEPTDYSTAAAFRPENPQWIRLNRALRLTGLSAIPDGALRPLVLQAKEQGSDAIGWAGCALNGSARPAVILSLKP
jgi:hypothetical protein